MIQRDGYELIIGSSVDPQFGPVLLFGSGGQLVEVYKDRALALPPLTTTLARRTMEKTKIYTALKGFRGRAPVDTGELEKLLVRFSQLVVEQRWVKEIDINPLLASPEGLIALDARVVLHQAGPHRDELPKPAIRPYPNKYVGTWTMKNGETVAIRPIRPEDEPLIVQFHETLSEHSVYMRYFQSLQLSQRTAHERLTRICFIDYNRQIALVAERQQPETGAPEIIGVGRLVKLHATKTGEAAVIVSDEYQRHGIGSELLARLIRFGRDEKLERVVADILPNNRPMQKVCERLGMKLRHDTEENVVKAEIAL
jgi:acetyltransferase